MKKKCIFFGDFLSLKLLAPHIKWRYYQSPLRSSHVRHVNITGGRKSNKCKS